MDVRSFTVGPFAENTYFVRRDGAAKALPHASASMAGTRIREMDLLMLMPREWVVGYQGLVPAIWRRVHTTSAADRLPSSVQSD